MHLHSRTYVNPCFSLALCVATVSSIPRVEDTKLQKDPQMKRHLSSLPPAGGMPSQNTKNGKGPPQSYFILLLPLR